MLKTYVIKYYFIKNNNTIQKIKYLFYKNIQLLFYYYTYIYFYNYIPFIIINRF